MSESTKKRAPPDPTASPGGSEKPPETSAPNYASADGVTSVQRYDAARAKIERPRPFFNEADRPSQP